MYCIDFSLVMNWLCVQSELGFGEFLHPFWPSTITAHPTPLYVEMRPLRLARALLLRFRNVATRGSSFWWLGRVAPSANFADRAARLCSHTGSPVSHYTCQVSPRTFRAIFSYLGNLLSAARGDDLRGICVCPMVWYACCR